ncbi:hypothetical protein [Puia dinghuensis]|uniref:Uncharacterized protein n=1 Tax=Puia dinghuensis TaxID=1792502 RepID=A0A8J2XXY8_9BACT|nr:hypothetical protein [Puia dinghuensis]GGB25358.1 hypothetical protein GCM10011511_56620 [Puia dinghuensis]
MTSVIRLGSVVEHGVGGPETGAINLIYTSMLNEFGQGCYRYIGINQIGEELNEFVMKEAAKTIYVNIRYPVYRDFESKSTGEKNRIRLDVIHAALVRIAEYDRKFDVQVLELIKEKILEKDFSFEFVCKSFVFKKKAGRIAKVVLQPEINKFNYYVVIEDAGKTIRRLLMYVGLTDTIYVSDLFSEGKWKSENEIVITGKLNEVEISVFVSEGEIRFKNLTSYAKPPYFEMMRADISEEDRAKAHQDWRHSLPPAVTAIIRKADN